MNWTNGEPGPNCFCGKETFVIVDDYGISLMCLFHTKSEGASFALPNERPEKWPDMTNEEMVELTKEREDDD